MKRKIILLAFFLSGFAGLMYEVTYSKGLGLIMGSSIYAYSIVLAAFLSGLGFGSLFIKKHLKKALERYTVAQIGIGFFGLLFILILNRIDVIYYVITQLSQNDFTAFSVLLLGMSYLILFIPAALMGMTFPLISSVFARKKYVSKDVGTLFSINTLGGIFGAFSAGYIFIPTIGFEKTILVCVILSLVIAAIMLTIHATSRTKYAIAIGLLFIVALLMSPIQLNHHRIGIYYDVHAFESLEAYKENVAEAEEKANFVFQEFGTYGSVSVLENNGYRSLLINGKTDAGTAMDIPTQLLLGYIPLFSHKNPESVGVIGFGSGITLAATERFPVKEIDLFEINPLVIEAGEQFSKENRNALDDERVNVIIADARNYLAVSEKKYDVITSEPSNPWIGGEGYLFTKEFYELVEKRLNKDGIFTQWVGAYDFNPEDLEILLNTIHHVFDHVQLWSDQKGSDLFITASNEPITINYIPLRNLFISPEVRDDFRQIGLLTGRDAWLGPDLFFSFYVAGTEDLEHFVQTKKINTDNKPIIEFHTGKNRIEGSRNTLIPLLDSMSENNIVRTNPPITNIYIEDIALFMNDLRFVESPSSVEYYYNYVHKGTEDHFVNLQLEIKKTLQFQQEDSIMTLHAHPQSREAQRADFERIAELLNARIVTEREIDTTRYIVHGQTNTGVLWQCRSHIYIGFFQHENVSSQRRNEMENTLLNIAC